MWIVSVKEEEGVVGKTLVNLPNSFMQDGRVASPAGAPPSPCMTNVSWLRVAVDVSTAQRGVNERTLFRHVRR